jgi:signal transduction histidine kinase
MMNTANAINNYCSVARARKKPTIAMRLNVSATMESVHTKEVWKSEFITQISHEMRTPLTSIIGYAEVMLSDPKLPQEAKEEYATIIRDAGKRLSRFLDSYIESEVVERNRQLTESRREDLSILAQRAIDAISGMTLSKSITLTLKCDPEIHIHNTSPDHLVQIFENLLTNAIDLAPQGGHIEFIVRRHEHRIQIEIINTDHGFLSLSPAVAGKKFRWKQSPGIEIRHEGLGLAFAKHVVELEGGLLNIQTFGEGLAFTLQFPCNVNK